MPPRELAGKWVAWSSDGTRIIASAETLDEVRAQAARVEQGRVSFEKLPMLSGR